MLYLVFCVWLNDLKTEYYLLIVVFLCLHNKESFIESTELIKNTDFLQKLQVIQLKYIDFILNSR